MGIRARDHETDHECLWLRIDNLDHHFTSLLRWNVFLTAAVVLLTILVVGTN